MATKVQAPVNPSTEALPSSPASNAQTSAAKSSSTQAPAGDTYQKAAQELINYKSSPLLSGASKIFTDGVVFPAHLLDTKDATNDAKYLRLIAAVMGFDEIERYFNTTETEEETVKRLKKTKRQQDEESSSKGEESPEEDPEADS